MKSNKRMRPICLILSVLLAFSLFAANVGASTYSDNERIDIGLKFGGTAVASASMTCSAGFMVINYDEATGAYTPVFQTAETAISVKNIGGKAIVFSSSGAPLYTGSDTLYLRGNNNSLKYESKIYLEVMKFFCKDGLMRVINILTLENYIKGVLPREIYPSWPDESLKTAAIVARSFALSSLSGKHKNYGFDVCTTTCCQVFGGNGSNENQRTNAAIDATRSIVVAYGNDVALTVYTSSVGDHTESSSGAWGSSQAPYPYLCGVATPHETPSEYPNGQWSVTVSAAELKDYINSKNGGALTGDILSIEMEYGETGFGRKITVTDTNGNTVSASTSGGVRNFLSKYVKSAKYTISASYIEEGSTVSVLTANGVETRPAIPYGAYVLRSESETPTPLYPGYIPLSFTINGTGYGHGVGLSQFGAYTMATNGFTYDQIIAHYFPGTYLTTLGALGVTEPQPTAQATETIEATETPETAETTETVQA